MKSLFGSLLISSSLFFATQASAVMVSFSCISNINDANCAAGESQIGLEVTDAGNDQVLFKFTNSGPEQSFLSDIYFDNDDGTNVGSTLNSIDSLQESAGVDFNFPIRGNGDLPGGNTIGFDTTMELEAQNAPGAANGVNNTGDEMLGMLFNLQAGKVFADVVEELGNGALRVGIHVQGFSDGGSEAFVSTPVPLPAAAWMLGTGMLGLLSFRRRKMSS